MRKVIFGMAWVLAFGIPAFSQSPSAWSENPRERAQEVLKLAREALGGEANLKAIHSLLATGNFRSASGEKTVQGNLKIELLLPDRYMRTAKMYFGPVEVTRVEVVNGDAAWADISRVSSPPGGLSSGVSADNPGGGSSRGASANGAIGAATGHAGGGAGSATGAATSGQMGGGRGGLENRQPAPGVTDRNVNTAVVDLSPEAQSAIQRQVRSDYLRLILAVLLSTPPSANIEMSFEREMDLKDGRVDIIKVMGPDGLGMYMLFDQKTHRPWMINYAAPALQSSRVNQNLDENGEPRMLDIQLFFADHKLVGNVWLPHRIVKSANGRMIEELKLNKYKINPEFKAGKFEKKKS